MEKSLALLVLHRAKRRHVANSFASFLLIPALPLCSAQEFKKGAGGSKYFLFCDSGICGEQGAGSQKFFLVRPENNA